MRQIKNLTNGIETSKALSALLSTKQWHLPNIWSRLLLKVCKRRVCVLRVVSFFHKRCRVLQKPQSKTSKTEREKLKKKTDRGIVKYNIYYYPYNGRRWVIKTEVYWDGQEMLYAFTKKTINNPLLKPTGQLISIAYGFSHKHTK